MWSHLSHSHFLATVRAVRILFGSVFFGTLYKLNYERNSNEQTNVAVVYNFTVILMDKRTITCVLHADFTKIHF